MEVTVEIKMAQGGSRRQRQSSQRAGVWRYTSKPSLTRRYAKPQTREKVVLDALPGLESFISVCLQANHQKQNSRRIQFDLFLPAWALVLSEMLSQTTLKPEIFFLHSPFSVKFGKKKKKKMSSEDLQAGPGGLPIPA